MRPQPAPRVPQRPPPRTARTAQGVRADLPAAVESFKTPAGLPRYLGAPAQTGPHATGLAEQDLDETEAPTDTSTNTSTASDSSHPGDRADHRDPTRSATPDHARHSGQSADAARGTAQDAAPTPPAAHEPMPAEARPGSGGRGGGGGADSGDGADGTDDTGRNGATAAQSRGRAPGAGSARSGSPRSDSADSGADGNTAPAAPAGTAPGAVPGLADLGLGDLALIDTELAEHQRWGQAAAAVGAASSDLRAAFVLEQTGSGFLAGAGSGFGTGLAIGLGTRVASKAVPVLGPIIGGGMALHGLISGREATREAVGRFGEGNSPYEVLANSIDAISSIINVVTGVLNIIGSVVSIVEIAAASVAAGGVVATVLTVGAAAPVVAAALEVVATCQEISTGITLVSTTLDGINQIVLQPSVTLFRALHSFTSQADPREVEAQGQQLNAAAAASGGSLGGWLGGKAAHIGAGRPPAPREEADAPPRQPPHETPSAASAEPPAVHFDEPAAPRATPASAPDSPEIAAPAPRRITDEAPPASPAASASSPEPAAATTTAAPTTATDAPAPATPHAAEAAPAKPSGPIDERSFASLQPEIDALNNSPLGDRLAAQSMAPMADVPRDTTRSPQAVHDAAYAAIPNQRPAGHGAPNIQDQHWTKVKDATIKASPGTSPASVDAINANRSPLNSRSAHESTLLLTTQGLPDSALPTGRRGTTFLIGNEPMGRPAQPAGPGHPAIPAEPGAPGGPPLPADASRYSTEHKFADAYLIPAQAEQIQASRARAGLPPLDDVQLAVAAGEQTRYIMEGVPSTDLAQNPTRPWSGEMITRPTEPMQLPLQPRDPQQRAEWQRTVRPRRAAPEPETPPPTTTAADSPSPQLSFDFEPSATRSRPVTDDAATAPPPIRSTRPLTDAEFAAHRDALIARGVPPDQIRRGDYTAFHPDGRGGGHITVGPDVNPLPEGQRPANLANPANAALDAPSALSHESIGHREAELAGQARPDDPQFEEAQASARAAVLDPDLNPTQREQLMSDSAARLRGRDNNDNVYMYMERPGATSDNTPAAGAPRPDSHFRPQDQLPSVIVDPALQAETGAAATPSRPAAAQSSPTTPPRAVSDAQPDPSPRLLPGISDAEIDAAFAQARGGPMLQANHEDMRLRLPKSQGGEYWGVDPASNMTVQEWNVAATRGMPRRDAAGQEVAGPRGDVRTQVRLHSPDPTAPAGGASASDWTMNIEQGNARMRADGTWFDTRYGLDSTGQSVHVGGYQRDTGGRWVDKQTGQPVTHPETLNALADWDRSMAASHIPLFPPAATGRRITDTAPAGGSSPPGAHQGASAATPPAGAAASAAPSRPSSSGRASGQTTTPGEARPAIAPSAMGCIGQGLQMLRPHLFGLGDGPAPTPAEIEAQHRARFTADNQPQAGVERVNPDYPAPPGTPQQIEQMQQEIARLLAERARAEQEAAHQQGRVDRCEANQGPIRQTLDDTAQGLSATQAHADAVARRDATNQAQQQRQQEAQGLVAGYPSRATGLAVLTIPLAAWRGFTGLASHLPGSAGRRMVEMNRDATQMQQAFDRMGGQMLGIDQSQPEQQATLQGDQQRLQATSAQADRSDAHLRTAQAGAQGLQQANQASHAEAGQLRDAATQRGQQLGQAADERQQQARTLSERMQQWAVQHQAARQRAIDATRQRLIAQGKRNVRVSGHD